MQTYFLLWPFKHRPAGGRVDDRAAAHRQARGRLPARRSPRCRASRCSVEPGQIVAMLGTNGAGKTTTLRAISGFLGIDDARVTDGTIVSRASASRTGRRTRSPRLGIALVPERDKVFPNLTVAENLAAPLSPRDRPRRAPPPRSAGLSVLSARSPICAAASAGCFRAASGRCWRSAARSSAHPELLLVDELSLGLAPVVVEDLMRAAGRASAASSVITICHRRAERRRRARHRRLRLRAGERPRRARRRRRAAARTRDIQEFYLGQAGGERRSYRGVKQYRRSRRWYG